MRKLLLCGALAAATAVPALAQAQARCVNPQTNASTGALFGAAGGAAVGAALDRNHAAGALLGALGGAVLGGAVGNSQVRCPEGYYRYEGGHYYDNGGAEYRPTGYAPAYTPPPPAYQGPPPGPGYGPPPQPGYYAPGATYGFWQGAPERLEDRISFTQQQVQRASNQGWISRMEARRAYRDIANVRSYVNNARNQNYGHLRPEDRQYVTDQLNYISQRVHWEARN